MFVLGEYFDYDTFVVLVSIVGGCAIVSPVTTCCSAVWQLLTFRTLRYCGPPMKPRGPLPVDISCSVLKW